MEPFQHQAAALAEIVARAKAFYDGYWRELPIKPRFHTLVVAPTGVGKSALATMAAAEISETSGMGSNVELFRLSVPGWIPGGSTSRSIAQAVALNSRTLLVLDELDKATNTLSGGGSGTSSGWQQHCLLEIFDLLDGRWPPGLKSPDDSDDNEIPLNTLTKKLQETVFILAIGTFQDYFDNSGSRRTIGFGSETDAVDEISCDDLIQKLPRELVNRFSGLIRLPELQTDHYRLIAKQACDSLPERMRQAFSEAVATRIGAAIAAKKGVRFLEESLMEVLKNLPAEPKFELIAVANSEPEIDPFDLCIS